MTVAPAAGLRPACPDQVRPPNHQLRRARLRLPSPVVPGRRMSRQELAEALGINYQTVGYIERGDYNPSLELVFRISELFGLPIEAIFSREPFRPLSEEIYGRQDARELADDNAVAAQQGVRP